MKKPLFEEETKKISQDKIELFDELGISRGFFSKRNILNDLTGKEWVYWSKSVINKPYPANLQHRLRSKHGAQKPPQLCLDIIKIFTKKNQKILDPLMGVGGTLLGASLCSRKAVGVDIESKWIKIYKRVCKLENIKKQETYVGDCRYVLPKMHDKFDFILTDVPYWDMDLASKSKGKYKKVGEEAKEAIKSKLNKFYNRESKTKDEWLAEMKEIFTLCLPCLKNGKYMALFVGDMYYAKEYHCLSAELADVVKSIKGFKWKANLIWYDVSNKLHIYGYLYSYIPSMIHQNILVFKKEVEK